MNMEAFIKELIAQGGFAVLAAVMGYLLFKQGDKWASDNKERAHEAEALQRETLEGIRSLAVIAERLTNGRRSGMHDRRGKNPQQGTPS